MPMYRSPLAFTFSSRFSVFSYLQNGHTNTESTAQCQLRGARPRGVVERRQGANSERTCGRLEHAPLVAAIDDDVARLHVLHQVVNGLVYRGASLYQDDDTPAERGVAAGAGASARLVRRELSQAPRASRNSPWALQGGDKLLHVLETVELGAQTCIERGTRLRDALPAS